MVVPAILIGIGSIIAGIWSGVKTVSETLFNILRVIFDWFINLFTWFLAVAPTFLKVIFFLFLLLFISNAIVGTYLHLNFYCDSNNNLYQPKSFFDGVKMFFTTSMSDIENSTLTYNEYIANNTIPVMQYDRNKAESIIYPKCVEQTPRLMLFGAIDFLSFKLWLVILLIIGILGIMKELNMWSQKVYR